MVLHNSAEAFADNWAYLKAELHWLDRLLMLAVARQRKDSKDLDRIAQSKADRVTSHWWKGVISLETEIAHDEVRKPQRPATSHQQQLDARILASQEQGVPLGLPTLRDRLKLTAFEKNLIVLALAPEINRRYARLYRFLHDEAIATDLPTVDLALRLLCRTDQEWREARTRLSASMLRQRGLLRLLPAESETLLAQAIQIDRALIDFLLADQPSAARLDSLLQPRSIALTIRASASDWNQLVLPSALLQTLEQIVHRQAARLQLADWNMAPANSAIYLTGAAGTGKTLAAEAIAHALLVPLVSVDLALVEPEADAQLLEKILATAPTVLLISSAQLWFGRRAADSRLSQVALTRLLQQRQGAITLLETRSSQPIRPYWQQQLQTLTFPNPSAADRKRLWQQAFAPEVAIDPKLPWLRLARSPLSGGEITAIAREATVNWVRSGEVRLTLQHIQQAQQQYQ